MSTQIIAGPLWLTLTDKKVKMWNDLLEWDYKIIRTKDRKFIINQHDVIEIEEENFRMVDGSAIFFKDCEWLDETNSQQVFSREQVEKIIDSIPCHVNHVAWFVDEYKDTNFPPPINK